MSLDTSSIPMFRFHCVVLKEGGQWFQIRINDDTYREVLLTGLLEGVPVCAIEIPGGLLYDFKARMFREVHFPSKEF